MTKSKKGYTAADLAAVESPEISAERFARMRPASEVVPHIVERARKRGERGPQKAPTKEVVTMRLDPVIIRHFKAAGPGWQTRVNDVLKKIVARDARTGQILPKAKLSAMSGSAKKATRRA